MRIRTYQRDLSKQQGAATLITTLVLLFTTSLATLYTHRGAVLEQHISANQYRTIQSMEAAEAGLETGFAFLNVLGLRNTYIKDTDSDGLIDTATNSFSKTIDANLSYRVDYTNPTNPGQLNPITITSIGCSDGCSPCNTDCPAHSIVTQIAHFRPLVMNPPDAPLTAKGDVSLSGNTEVTNTDSSTGTTIQSGGEVTLAGSSKVQSPSGEYKDPDDPDANIIQNDTTLSSLTDKQFFEHFFEDTKDAVKNASVQITCSGVCNSKLNGRKGQSIWVTGNTTLNSNTIIGSPTEPVILIVDGNLHVNGTVTIYGIVYCAYQEWDTTGGGTARIYGAAIAEGDFIANGTPNPTYDVDVLDSLNANLGRFAKVIGSWADF